MFISDYRTVLDDRQNWTRTCASSVAARLVCQSPDVLATTDIGTSAFESALDGRSYDTGSAKETRSRRLPPDPGAASGPERLADASGSGA